MTHITKTNNPWGLKIIPLIELRASTLGANIGRSMDDDGKLVNIVLGVE